MKKIFTILLLSGSLLVSGCSDWLDVLPKDKQSTDMYWESSEDVEAILAQGYSRLRTCVPYIINWGELRGSSVIVPGRNKNRSNSELSGVAQYINSSMGYLLPSDRYGECCVEICTNRDGQRCELL